MHWIVQENICQEAKYDEMIRYLEQFEIPHTIVKVVPFSGELIPEPALPFGSKVWCMGSLSMTNTCKKRGWSPGCIELDKFDFQDQVNLLGSYMLNIGAFCGSIWEFHLGQLPFYSESFVRPIDDSKFIKGQIMSASELQDWIQNVMNLPESDVSQFPKIVVAKKKEILREARFWVIDGDVVTWSQYKCGKDVWYSEKEVPDDMIDFVADIVDNLYKKRAPVSTYCLDVAEIPGTRPYNYRVVEFNNINSSGLYDCDVQKLVEAIQRKFGNW